VSGLAQKLEAVLGDEALRIDLGQASLAQVQAKYSFKAMLSAYQVVFERALG